MPLVQGEGRGYNADDLAEIQERECLERLEKAMPGTVARVHEMVRAEAELARKIESTRVEILNTVPGESWNVLINLCRSVAVWKSVGDNDVSKDRRDSAARRVKTLETMVQKQS